MTYQTIHPGLSGIDAENAYIMVCKQVLPAGLLGLMLTGMYFSTSASANTALNVVSAVFTNDIYKGSVNPHANDKKLMFVARASSWFFGVFMILIALGFLISGYRRVYFKCGSHNRWTVIAAAYLVFIFETVNRQSNHLYYNSIADGKPFV